MLASLALFNLVRIHRRDCRGLQGFKQSTAGQKMLFFPTAGAASEILCFGDLPFAFKNNTSPPITILNNDQSSAIVFDM